MGNCVKYIYTSLEYHWSSILKPVDSNIKFKQFIIQYGFRKDKSPIEAIYELVEQIAQELDSKNSVSSIFSRVNKSLLLCSK